MEKELFTYEHSKLIDDLYCVYYNVELIKDLGKYKKGDKFYLCSIYYKSGTLRFFDDNDNLLMWAKLKLSVDAVFTKEF